MDNLDNALNDSFKYLPLSIFKDKDFKPPKIRTKTIITKKDYSIKKGMYFFVRKDNVNYCIISDEKPNGKGGNYGYFPPTKGRVFNVKTEEVIKFCTAFNINKVNIIDNI
jgi:hypothetical protein